MFEKRRFLITLTWTLQTVLFVSRAGSAEAVPADLSRLETLIERQGRLMRCTAIGLLDGRED